MLSPTSLSPYFRCMAMEEDGSFSPSNGFCSSSTFPSWPNLVLKSSSSSVTRPYTSAIKPSIHGSMSSSIKPSALLQRRSQAGHGFTVSAVNTGIAGVISDAASAATAYEVLQVSPSASQQEIKAAFWRLARQHHPDKAPFEQKDASTISFLQIHSAYVALKDPQARAQYDAHMSMDVSGYKQKKFSGISAEVKTPFTYRPHPNIFTPMQGAAPAAASNIPSTPSCTQVFTPSSFPQRSSHYFYTQKTPTAGATPNLDYTPSSPYTTGRSWETDQCW